MLVCLVFAVPVAVTLTRSYECRDCNRVYKHKTSLNRHLRRECPFSSVKCDLCEFVSCDRLALQQHCLDQHF